MKFRKTGSIEYEKIKGRPVKLSYDQIEQLVMKLDDDADLSRMTYSEMVRNLNLNITPKHLSQRLKEKGIKNRVAKRTVLLSEEAKLDRFQFVKDHFRLFTNWFRVIWSDEVQVQCDTKGRVFVKRRDGQAFHESKVVTHLKKGNLKVCIL